ncbi:unnamed protein product [Prunus armeniaca]|uniref:Uncharacterized protein n=1 Tax=Prunus armeniaca TaxID=36596 RepID=A0A6J5WHZ9_PRUAR|nr:unnamed protein product [Prunus armeniaca]
MSPAASLVQQKIRLFVKKFGKGFHSKKAYTKLEHGDIQVAPKGYVFLYVGEERKRYTVSLKCLSCPAFEEAMVESQPDVFDVKIEGPIELLSCTTEDFHKLMSKIKEGH